MLGIYAKSITFPSTLKIFNSEDGGISYDPFFVYTCEKIYVPENILELMYPFIKFELEHPYIKVKPIII